MIKVSGQIFSTSSWKNREGDLKSTVIEINSITLFYINAIK